MPAVNGGQRWMTGLPPDQQAELDLARLAAIVEGSDDAITSATLDGVVTSWNAGAERLFGYSAAEVVGRSLTFLVPPGRDDELPQILARIRAGERVAHFETAAEHPGQGPATPQALAQLVHAILARPA
jgi:PAS domain-containing protein